MLARSRASEVAQDRLSRKLAKKARPPVPCPQCFYLAPSFAAWGALKLLPIVLVGAFIILCGIGASEPSRYDTPTPAAKALGPVCELLGLALILVPATLYLYRIGLGIPPFRRAAVWRYQAQVLAPGYRHGTAAAVPASSVAQELVDDWDGDEDDLIPFASSQSPFDEPSAPVRRPVAVNAPMTKAALPAKPAAKMPVKTPAPQVAVKATPVRPAPAAAPVAAAAAKPQALVGSTLVASCGNCGKSFRVQSKFAGKKAKCTGCSTPITIPAA